MEQDVIILSLTRSNPAFVENDVKRRMGLFGMPKQANVALTRAENLFIVIGNPESMWEDQLWRQWVSNFGREGQCVMYKHTDCLLGFFQPLCF